MHDYELHCALKAAPVFRRRTARDLFGPMAPMQAEFAPADRTVFFDGCQSLAYRPIAPDTCWGHTWNTGFFRLHGVFPERAAEPCEAVLRLNFGGEALLFAPDGRALTGLTNNCWFEGDFVRELYYPKASGPGEKCAFYAGVSANKLSGLDVSYDPPMDAEVNGSFAACFRFAACGWIRTGVRELLADLDCLLSLLKMLPEKDYRRKQFAAAFAAAERVYCDDPANAAAARAELAPLLARPAAASALNVTAVGHAHIDTAYMWPVRETIRKTARTFATQLDLLERYPDYVFGASQPQHYWFVKHYYPELYQRVKAAVAAGRWELQGGMWVEADVNLPNGESLVRQFLYGKNFFREEFGVEVRNLWLPDVFGYSAALPQLMKLADCASMVTAKMAMNECNHFPLNTFRWRGIDGSEVLVNIPPEGFYSSFLLPESLRRAQDQYAENSECGEFISLFGLGDGGGGPRHEDVASGRRVRDLEGLPRLAFGAAQPLFDRQWRNWEQLPVWEGELYFEKHRGTLTSQARIKRANRKAEQMLAAVEILYSALPPERYPEAVLEKNWKRLLLNQFHDIIPGSAITEVYTTALEELAALQTDCRELLAAAAQILPQDPDTLTWCNTLNTVYRGAAEIPANWAGHTVRFQGRDLLPYQGTDGRWLVPVELPPLAFAAAQKGAEAAARPESAKNSSPILENALIRYEFNVDLELVRAVDKETGRAILGASGVGNRIALYRDYPENYEAWDINLSYESQLIATAQNPAGAVTVRQDCSGQELEARLVIGKSAIRQRIRLANDSRLLEFDTEVDWQETRKMLRVAFPTSLQSAEARYDVQFGALVRPTHRNGDTDLAKFEVLHHQYMDLSEPGYGAALLNDCKYGGKVLRGTLDLALLRSPKYPSIGVDRGRQLFRYAFLPHPGDAVASAVAEQAEAFNREPLLLAGCDGSALTAPIALNTTAVTLAACKKAEKGGDWIVRLAERNGTESVAELSWSGRFAALVESDLLEWHEIGPLQNAAPAKVRFKSFEVKTFRLKR